MNIIKLKIDINLTLLPNSLAHKKKSFILIKVILCLLLLSACNKNITEATESDKTKRVVHIFVNDSIKGQTNVNDSVKSPYRQLSNYLFDCLKAKSDELNIDLKKEITNGSYQTLLGMERIDNISHSAIGIAQADVLYHYFNGNHPQFPVPKSDSKIRALGSVFEEWLFIHSSDSIHKSSLSDQQISKLDLGVIGSGTMVSALNMERLLSLRPNKDLSKGDSIKFRIFAPYDSSINHIKGYNELVSLSQAEAETIASSFPDCYDVVDSKEFKAQFKNLQDSINHRTVSVDAVLIGLSNLPDEVVGEIETLLNNYPEPYIDFDKNDLPIARHKKLIYDKIRSEYLNKFVADWFTRHNLFVIFWVLVILVIFNYLKPAFLQIMKYQLSIRASLKLLFNFSIRIVWLALGFILLHIFIACLIWGFEYHYSIDHYIKSDALIANGVVGGIAKIGESLVVGEQLYVFSVEAKILIAILNLAYAVTSSFFVYQYSNSIFKRLRKNLIMDNHTVIIGWNEVTPKVVDELISFGQKKYQIIGTQESSTIGKDRYRNHYHQKNASISDLESVRLSKAKAVIIMSDKNWAQQESVLDVDLWSLRILKDIVIFKEKNKLKFRIVAEVKDIANETLLLDNGADEVICISSFGYELLPHAGSRPKLSLIFKELLKTEKGNNEIYYMDLKIDKSKNPQFSDVISFLNNGNMGLQAIAIGVLKKQGELSTPILNPNPELELNEEDKIVVITKGTPKNSIII